MEPWLDSVWRAGRACPVHRSAAGKLRPTAELSVDTRYSHVVEPLCVSGRLITDALQRLNDWQERKHSSQSVLSHTSARECWTLSSEDRWGPGIDSGGGSPSSGSQRWKVASPCRTTQTKIYKKESNSNQIIAALCINSCCCFIQIVPFPKPTLLCFNRPFFHCSLNLRFEYFCLN